MPPLPVEPRSAAILLRRHVLEPIDRLAVELLVDRDVRHGRLWCCAMPVLLTWRKRDDITRPDVFDGPAPTLRAPSARRDDERLPQRMRMPRCPGARFERDGGAARARRRGCVEQRIDSYGS